MHPGDQNGGQQSIPEKCATCGALQRAICAHLDAPTLTRLSAVTRTHAMTRGQSLLWQGR